MQYIYIYIGDHCEDWAISKAIHHGERWRGCTRDGGHGNDNGFIFEKEKEKEE